MTPSEDRDEAVERVLRASAPRPEDPFVDSLERRLGLEPRRERRPLLLGALASAATAAALVVLALVGSGPLSLDGDGTGDAADDCTTVTIEKRIQLPVIVVDRQGRETIALRAATVPQPVRRCP